MDNIMVSISCITYNHEDYIADAIESFLMQKTEFKFEVLIHDDASTDGTRDIIKKYEKEYPNIIKPIIQKENQMSKGIKRIGNKFNQPRARGKYIALCEGDDYWTDPFKLQKQVEYMEKNPNCTLCAHTVEEVNPNKKKVGVVRPYTTSSISKIEDIILGGGYFFGTTSLMYKKKNMDNPPSLYINASAGDYPLQILMAYKGYAYFIDEPMAAYRVGVKGSWSDKQRNSQNRLEKQINHFKKVIKMLEEFNIYSENKYRTVIEEQICKYKLNKLLKERRIAEIKQGELKEYYDLLSVSEKAKINLNYYFPNIYQKLVNIKKNLRGNK